MKFQLCIAVALSAIAVSAMAQPFGPPPPPGSFWYGAPIRVHERIDFLDHRMQAMLAGGRLSKTIYDGLSYDLKDVRFKEKDFLIHDGGVLTPDHNRYLELRLHKISDKLNWDSHWGY